MTHTNRPSLLNRPATGEHPNQRPFDCRLALKLEASNPFEPPESTKPKQVTAGEPKYPLSGSIWFELGSATKSTYRTTKKPFGVLAEGLLLKVKSGRLNLNRSAHVPSHHFSKSSAVILCASFRLNRREHDVPCDDG